MSDVQEINRRGDEVEFIRSELYELIGAKATHTIGKYIDAKIKFAKSWDAATTDGKSK